jgi:hypothetical protein
MKEIATIRFVDCESNGDGVAIIRAKGGCVALCLSSAENGDAEVFLSVGDVDNVLGALSRAKSVAQVAE